MEVGAANNDFLLDEAQIKKLRAIADGILRSGESITLHNDTLTLQVLYLALYETQKNKALKSQTGGRHLTSQKLGLKKSWLSVQLDHSNPDSNWAAEHRIDTAFRDSVLSLEGKHPHINWRDIPQYDARLKELGLEDVSAQAPDERRRILLDRNSVGGHLDAIVHAYKHTENFPKVQKYLIQRQAIFLLLLESQPDKNIHNIGAILGLPEKRTSTTLFKWKAHYPTFTACCNSVCGGHPYVDWQSIAGYRKAIEDAGLGDLLDQTLSIRPEAPDVPSTWPWQTRMRTRALEERLRTK